MAEVLAKAEKYINDEEASYPRKDTLQPIKRKTGLTSDRDGAPKDKETERGPQRKTENDPRKDVETLETA